MMKNKEDIINKIIAETGAKSYVEIGYGTGYNFDKIECEIKVGIDPDVKKEGVLPQTSDEFFDTFDPLEGTVFFIDGLHHCEQVRKDITNALKCNPKVIIIHDTLPPDEAHQVVPRAQKQWTGDCWRAAVGFIESYPDVRVETYRSDYGLSVIYPEGKKTRKYFEDTETSYEYFKKNAVELLNIID